MSVRLDHPGRSCSCAAHARLRRKTREWHQRRRDAALAERMATAHRCPHRHGSGVCGARLETTIGEHGRTVVVCPKCERRRRGICRDCPARVYGQIGKAIRCQRCADRASREQERACEERHRDEYRAKGRAYYHQPEVKARRNEYKRAWRKANREKVRAQKQRYVDRQRLDPNSWYNQYHRRYRTKYRLQKRELERDRLRAAPPPRKTSPKCSRCGKSTRWRPLHRGHAGKPWTVCTKCLFPCERKVRLRNRRRARIRAKEWFASIPKPERIKRPPQMAKRGPGLERLCITPGCETVLTHRRKKCSRCLEADARAADRSLAPARGRGRRTDLERVA